MISYFDPDLISSYLILLYLTRDIKIILKLKLNIILETHNKNNNRLEKFMLKIMFYVENNKIFYGKYNK